MIETISIDKLLRYVRDPKSLYVGGQYLLMEEMVSFPILLQGELYRL